MKTDFAGPCPDAPERAVTPGGGGGGGAADLERPTPDHRPETTGAQTSRALRQQSQGHSGV